MILCPSWVTAGTHLLFVLLRAVLGYCTPRGNIVDLIIGFMIFQELACCRRSTLPNPIAFVGSMPEGTCQPRKVPRQEDHVILAIFVPGSSASGFDPAKCEVSGEQRRDYGRAPRALMMGGAATYGRLYKRCRECTRCCSSV